MENKKFRAEEVSGLLIPGTHRMSGYVIEDGVYKYKVYNPDRCEIILEIYLTDNWSKYGDNLTKSRFLNVIKQHGLTKIKRVVNIVSIETHEEYRGQGIATALLLDFLKGYRTSTTDIVVTHCIPGDQNAESLEDFWNKHSDFCADFENFFEPFGFKSVPDLSETDTITLTNSYLFLTPESEAARSLNKIFNRKTWGTKDE